jgi:hypothetical protein
MPDPLSSPPDAKGGAIAGAVRPFAPAAFHLKADVIPMLLDGAAARVFYFFAAGSVSGASTNPRINLVGEQND